MTETPEGRRLVEDGFLVAVLLWGLYVLGESLTYDEFLAWSIPVLVSVPMILLSLLKLLHNHVDNRVLNRLFYSDFETGERDGTARERTVLVLTMFVYLVAITQVGFFYAMPIFLFAYFYGFDLYSPTWSVLVAVAVWFAISFLFGSVFDVPGVFLGPFSEFEVGIF